MANDSESEENQGTSKKEAKVVNIFTVVSAFLILFAFIAPILFTQCSTGVIFGSETGPIGDTFGIMNPFIAIAAAIITFAAFWVQYKANVDVRADVKEDRKEKRKQQIISRFYEMLQIHRENVKELEWLQNIHLGEGKYECVQKKGRQIFFYYQIEFDFIYSIIDVLYSELNLKEKVKKAYDIFFRNLQDEKFDKEKRNLIKNVIQNYNSVSEGSDYLASVSKPLYDLIFNNGFIEANLKRVFECKDYFKLQPILNPPYERLNNYYSHLFLTVKMVVKEKEEFLSYNEKRDLLRILRAQLTVTEQIMLFYNWFSGNGWQWEQDDLNGFHFFTQYRMIYDLMPNRMLPIHLLKVNEKGKITRVFINYLKKEPIYTYIKKYCSKDDPMFEFEDWEGCPKFDYDK